MTDFWHIGEECNSECIGQCYTLKQGEIGVAVVHWRPMAFLYRLSDKQVFRIPDDGKVTVRLP